MKMNREILFKAKTIKDGKWVEGLLWKKKYNSHNIYISCFPDKDDHEEVYCVDANTICQYTGLTDKNGNKIWENDVVECKNNKSHFQSQIEWDKSYCGFILQDSDTSAVGLDAITKGGIYKDVQVIGNIFDNPELLEGGAE
jgi:uncharacterized phage protein (TIGR01671 family)